eukprot:1957687-Rhodomonas_salina.2
MQHRFPGEVGGPETHCDAPLERRENIAPLAHLYPVADVLLVGIARRAEGALNCRGRKCSTRSPRRLSCRRQCTSRACWQRRTEQGHYPDSPHRIQRGISYLWKKAAMRHTEPRASNRSRHPTRRCWPRRTSTVVGCPARRGWRTLRRPLRK